MLPSATAVAPSETGKVAQRERTITEMSRQNSEEVRGLKRSQQAPFRPTP